MVRSIARHGMDLLASERPLSFQIQIVDAQHRRQTTRLASGASNSTPTCFPKIHICLRPPNLAHPLGCGKPWWSVKIATDDNIIYTAICFIASRKLLQPFGEFTCLLVLCSSSQVTTGMDSCSP